MLQQVKQFDKPGNDLGFTETALRRFSTKLETLSKNETEELASVDYVKSQVDYRIAEYFKKNKPMGNPLIGGGGGGMAGLMGAMAGSMQASMSGGLPQH